jgi:protein-S-isoprenylcysteine O-methyltransferase Ste14
VASAFRFVVALLFGILIFVGLPLIGWGIADLQVFFNDPARLSYTGLATLLEIFIVIKFPNVGRTGGEAKKTVQRQRWTVLLMQLFSLAIVFFAPYSDHQSVLVLGDGELIRYFGLALFVIGFVAMNWAEASLGKQFSIQVALQEDHQLVTGGLYRYLRHPRYLSIIIFNIGLVLIFRSGLALILLAALTLVLLWRIHDEENFMCQEFGTEWETYTKRSWRLIPFVY